MVYVSLHRVLDAIVSHTTNHTMMMLFDSHGIKNYIILSLTIQKIKGLFDECGINFKRY